MEVAKSFVNKVASGINNLVNGETDTEEIMFNPKIVDKNVNTDEDPILPEQTGGVDDPNSSYWEAEYYKYKHLYLRETQR